MYRRNNATVLILRSKLRLNRDRTRNFRRELEHLIKNLKPGFDSITNKAIEFLVRPHKRLLETKILPRNVENCNNNNHPETCSSYKIIAQSAFS